MVNLAIQGHLNRGNEVISYLEMLGGKNPYGCSGLGTLCAYHIINGNIQVVTIEDVFKSNKYILYSLEGILAKFPYKVGDEVVYKQKPNQIFITEKACWNGSEIAYVIGNKNGVIIHAYADELQSCKEETMEERQYKELRIPLDDDKLATEATINGNKILPPNDYLIGKITQMDNGMLVEYVKQQPSYPKDLPDKETNMESNKCTYCVYAVNNNHCGLRGFRSNFNVNYCSAQNVDKLPNGFELQEDGYFSWVNKKPKYPKTYEECCSILGCRANDFFTDFSYNNCDVEISDYEDKIDDLLQNFRKLIYCRDAYWKIAGEQMGLGKPWEPDWSTEDDIKYVIEVYHNNVRKNSQGYSNTIIAFPTAEMRDAFHKNFKELIENCKELL